MLRHLPNLICVGRIALVWPIVQALQAGRHDQALALFTVAAISDGVPVPCERTSSGDCAVMP